MQQEKDSGEGIVALNRRIIIFIEQLLEETKAEEFQTETSSKFESPQSYFPQA
jgi:hypothetical protein